MNMNRLKSLTLILFLLVSGNRAFAQGCSADPASKFASNSQFDLLKTLEDANGECRAKLYKDLSPKDSQHVCACRNYTGKIPERDIFAAKFAVQIQQVKEQYAEQTGKDPKKEKRLIDDLYANYLRAKDNLPCGNGVNIYPNKTQNTSVSNGGFYCAKNKHDADLLKLPLCFDKKETQASKDEMEKSIGDLYQRNFSDQEKMLSKQFVCNPSPKDGKDWSLVSQDLAPCSLNFAKRFKDNDTSYQTGVTDQSVMKEVQESECYQKVAKGGLAIDRVEIETSSSLLANTNGAADKTFQQLSEDRAKKIQDDVFRKIPEFENVNYQLNTSGKNNDGTSGPCPYQYTSNAPYWERRKEITDEMLEENKFVRAKVYYKNKVKVLQGTGDRLSLACSTVTFGCRGGASYSASSFK